MRSVFYKCIECGEINECIGKDIRHGCYHDFGLLNPVKNGFKREEF